MALMGFQPLVCLTDFHLAFLRGNRLGFVLSLTSVDVMTAIGCAWKYLRNLLAAKTSDRTSVAYEVNWRLNCASFRHQHRTNSSGGGGQ
ncbi:hypothetical protein Tco_0443838, partial [Tanacetum coccineum]